MNLRKLRLIEEAKKSFGSLSINEALLAYLRRFYDSTTSVAELVSKYLRGVFNAPSFDGVDDYGVLAGRAINPDGTIDVEWEQLGYDSAVAGSQTIVAQCNSTTITSREFVLRADSNETLSMFIGGSSFGTAAGVYGNGKWRSLLVGSNWSVFKDGSLVLSTTIARGAAREPTARTTIAARDAGAAQADYMKGLVFNVKINGTLWRMADRNQAIQLPEPSGLGAELITPTVLENPAVKGSQWTYLGAGRWQYVGDGTFNALQFIVPANQPAAGYVEFEVESITGQITCSSNGLSRSNFNSVGIKRYFYTDRNEGVSNGAALEFKRFPAGTIASCIIKNISFKPLDVASAELLTNPSLSNNAQNWTIDSVGVSVSGSSVRLTNTQASYAGFAMQTFNTVAGQDYLITGNFTAGTFARFSINAGATGGYTGNILAVNYASGGVGLVSAVFRATSNQATLRVICNSSALGDFIEINGLQIKPVGAVCNPMTLVNVTSDRWQEVAQ